jgi:hypothetical protein
MSGVTLEKTDKKRVALEDLNLEVEAIGDDDPVFD